MSPTSTNTSPLPPDEKPYALRIAMLGGVPTPGVDIPICAIFILLFTIAAIIHTILFVLDRRRAHRDLFSLLFQSFCIARIAALGTRIAWACHPSNLSITIVANILTAAGFIIIIIANLFFARRVVRDYTLFGDHRKILRRTCRFLVFCVIACLAMLVSAAAESFFKHSLHSLGEMKKIILFAATLLTVIAFLPLPLVGVLVYLPAFRDSDGIARDGPRFEARMQLLVATTLLVTLEAGFRCGVTYDARDVNQPGWFHHKACLYCLVFLLDTVLVFLYALARIDPRVVFQAARKESLGSEVGGNMEQRKRKFIDRVNTEIDVFGSGR
ncbi:hypothetical protein B0H63DRAFT_489971 [Podospora didyma]|uniref:Uncharacterized protein n=1 Tax=Podospora didyma TaxID=330526 RepID=A0AAE0K1M1_9PEZI|nr:hypothetical protein B0H63DRAFT_489971 [Podospora didyma]